MQRRHEAEAMPAESAARRPVARCAEPEPGAAQGRQPPLPLRLVVVGAQQSLAAMAGPDASRSDMHAFRNALSDLCALTFPNHAVTAAVGRVVEEADCFAELAFGNGAAFVCLDTRRRCYDRVWNALRHLTLSLADAEPSTVARALGRAW